MATVDEVMQMIKAETGRPDFKQMPFDQKTLKLKQLLSQSESFSGVGFAQQAKILKQVQEATGVFEAADREVGVGDAAQALLEFGAPIAGGALAARGGVGGALRGAGGAAGAGQITEFTRPILTDEPMRGIEEQALRRTAEALGEVGGQALSVGISKGIAASSNAVKNAMRKALIAPVEPGAAGEGAKRVFSKTGAGTASFQLRADNPEGFRAALEEIAFNSVVGRGVLNRVQNKQIAASAAWLEEMGATMAEQADGPSLVLFMEGLVKNRRDLSRGVERALYGNVEKAAGDIKININKVVDGLRPFRDTAAIRDVVSPSFPEGFPAPKAAPKPSPVAGQFDFPSLPIDPADAPQELTVKGALSRISELRKAARASKDPSVRNVAAKTAGDLERAVEAQMPPEAVPLWTAAKEFTKTSRETLSNKSLVKFLSSMAEEKPDSFLGLMLGRGRSDDMLRLKTALDKPIQAPDGSFIPGSNFWEGAVQPRIMNAVIDKAKVGLGRDISEMSGEKLANTLRGFSKQQTDELLGRGTFNGLKDLSDALTVAKKRPTNRFSMFVLGSQAAAAGGGITLASQGEGTSGAALLSLSIAPAVLAKILVNPATTRNFAQAIKNPGKLNRRLSAVVGRIATQAAAGTIEDSQLDETLESLKDVQQSRFGGFVPVNLGQ